MSNMTTNNVTPISNPSIALTLDTTVEVVQGMALSIVTFALQKNFAAQVPQPDFVYWTYVYLAQLFQNCLQDVVPQITEVPYWLKLLMDVLAPTTVTKATGSVSFNWNFPYVASTSQWTFDEQPSGNPRKWNCGNVTTTTVNTVLHEIVSPAAYNDADGKLAFLNFIKFVQESNMMGKVNEKWYQMVNPTATKTPYLNDPSVFAFIEQIIGNSGTLNGAYSKRVGSEVPIPTPLAAFVAKLQTGEVLDSTRTPSYTAYSAGDSVFFSGITVGGLGTNLMNTKRQLAFKPLDFFEFIDIMGQYMNEIGRLAVLDYQTKQVLEATPNPDPGFLTLDLTFQEWCLMWENALKVAFARTGYATQCVYPTDTLNNSDPFLPFVIGQGTYPSACDMPYVPETIAENIRQLTYRISPGSNPMGWFPVLGQYASTVLDPNQYGYYVGESFYPYFLTPVSQVISMRKNERINDAQKRLELSKKFPHLRLSFDAEQALSYIDGSDGTSYVAINGPFAMNTYANVWNEWTKLATPFTEPLTTFSVDAGVPLLSLVDKTRITYLNIPGTSKFPNHTMPPNHKTVVRDLPDRFKKHMIGLEDGKTNKNPYCEILWEAATSFQPLLEQTWQLIQSVMWMPSVRLFFNGKSNENMTLQKWQGFATEMQSQTFTQGDDQQTLYQMHRAFAVLLTKARNGDTTMAQQLLKKIEESGHGGILSTLVGGLIGVISPEIGKIISLIPV